MRLQSVSNLEILLILDLTWNYSYQSVTGPNSSKFLQTNINIAETI